MNKIGDNIISSLGFTSKENFCAVKAGISGVKNYEGRIFGLPETFMASLIDREKLNTQFSNISNSSLKNKYTDLEKAAILSVYLANIEAKIDLSNDKTLFIVSTTKGNVDLIGSSAYKSHVYLSHTANLIIDFFGNNNTPIVVVNACISGAAAQIAAMRALQSRQYDYAVVVGVDFLSKFIISGFQSFKALSPTLCKPFDKDRCGLNLGEAAATIIMNNEQLTINNEQLNRVRLVAGVIRNDATHISAPSRIGEGSYRALKIVLQNIDTEQISFINAHGTATPYNDASEVSAILRANLQNVPINSLKAFFGHTLGASGVLETIISMHALEENLIIKSHNFEIHNFEHQMNISTENQFSDKSYFVKMASGFGGCNATLLYRK